MVTLTTEEWAALGDPDKGGGPAKQQAHLAAEEKIVFGNDFQRDAKGNPVEQGIGSPGRPSLNSLQAIRKYEEEAYQAAVAKLWKDNPEIAKKLGLPNRRGTS
jgi:hypothetical protein